MKKNLCLVMIVKNESNQLARCFKHLKKHIDYYVIVDTGSTDNTINVIKNELQGIEGEVIERPWVNFGHNRTESLELARHKAKYLILSDADEQLIFDDSFNVDSLDHDQYMIKYQGSLDYSVPYLISGERKWEYVGVTHEYLFSPEAVTRQDMQSISIIDYGDGGAKSDKFERDILLLKDGLAKEPENSRYMFYLANSYRDIGDNRSAIIWYKRRIESGGWIEEVICSYEYMGECYNRMGDNVNAISTWLEGFDFNPNRAECIYAAIKKCRSQKRHNLAYVLLTAAKKIKYPETDILFIKREIYDSLLDYEMSIVEYYVNKDIKDANIDIQEVFKKLLVNPNIDYTSTISNYQYYADSLNAIESNSIDLKSLVPEIDGYALSTPAIIPDGQNYILNIRRVSYNFDKKDGYYYDVKTGVHAETINTINTYLKVDNNFKYIEHKDFITEDINTNKVNGLEDIRLIQIGDKIHYNANRWVGNTGSIQVHEGIYDITKDTLDYNIISSPKENLVEKNWSPFMRNGSKLYLYDWKPLEFGISSGNRLDLLANSGDELRGFRGSSPGIETGDELWFLAHVVEYSSPRKYYHSIAIFDKETLKYKRHSKLFTFGGENIEFSVGMVIEEDRVIIPHSTWDQEAKIKVYDREKLVEAIF